MATIRDIIERVDDIKPNAFSEKTKLAWIGELDGMVAADVMLMGIEDIRQMEYVYPDGFDTEPLVGYPHDGIYDEYLCAKIDYANGEYSKYQNSMEMFNAHYDNFIHWFIRTYAPAQGYRGGVSGKPPYYLTAYGLAVQQGYRGTLAQWLESLNGSSVEMRCVDNMIQWRLQEEPEGGWKDLASVAQFQQVAADAAGRAEEAAKHAEDFAYNKQNKLAWVTDEDIDAMFDGTYEGEENEDPEGDGYISVDEGAVLEMLVGFGIAPVLLDADGAVLCDGDGAILVNT